MIENIAIWGGVAGLIASLFAIIILFLTKQNINSILNKDKLLFNESFTTKKEAIVSAMAVVDQLIETQNATKQSAEFIKSAKTAYNNLLCVLTDVRIADEFYDITLDPTVAAGEPRLVQLKLMLRSDIGLKSKNSKAITRVIKDQQNVAQTYQPIQQIPQVPAQQTIPQAPVQPAIQQTQPAQPVVRPTAQPVRPTKPVAQPATQPKPAARPVAQTQVKKPVINNDDDDLF